MAIYHLKVISRLRKLTEEVFEIIQFLNYYNVQIKDKRKKEGRQERKTKRKVHKREKERECVVVVDCETLVKFVL
jgi:predicted ABC-class ATPase